MTPYYQEAGITIYHGDCREILPHVSADVVVTDPPYGTGGWRRPESGGGSNPRADLVREEWDDGALDWLAEIPTLTFWPPARTLQLLARAESVGLTKHRAIYWHKPDPKPQVGGRVAWSVEPIWVLSPEGFLLRGGTDWFDKSSIRFHRDFEAVGHPYQKPEPVMRWIIAKTEGAILDPFLGSGSTLIAAAILGRRAIGVEIEERYCEIAVKRLRQEVLPFEPPAPKAEQMELESTTPETPAEAGGGTT